MTLPKQIAIDGPAASGKSTIAELLANYLDYLYLDTGVMYRAVTLAALKILHNVEDEIAVTSLADVIQIDVRPASQDDGRKFDVLVDNVDITWEIRSPEVNSHVSQVSAYAGVRKAMTGHQRKIADRGNIIMVGRDIGTVVLPTAELKIFLKASLKVRARRRYDEEKKLGGTLSFHQVYESLKMRDEIDSTRELAPLKPAEDAVIINTENLNIFQVLEKVKSHILDC